MGDISRRVGQKIRLYRRIRKLTLQSLADTVHKSKATLSKYETGDIIPDVETLFEIAKALDISPQQLIDLPGTEVSVTSIQQAFLGKQYYLYFFDGRRNELIRSLIDTGSDGIRQTAVMYYALPAWDRLENCRGLYVGTVEYHDTITTYSFSNQSNNIERLDIFVSNPFEHTDRSHAMLSGLSRYPLLPVSIKCILSKTPLEENDALRQELMLSRRDLNLIKLLNMFAVDEH